jgi:hypothetical protein
MCDVAGSAVVGPAMPHEDIMGSNPGLLAMHPLDTFCPFSFPRYPMPHERNRRKLPCLFCCKPLSRLQYYMS